MATFKTGEMVRYTPPNGWCPVVARVRKEKRGYSVTYDAIISHCVTEVRAWLNTKDANRRLSHDLSNAEGCTRLAGLN